ncbi:hypothetical protein EZS27_019115 [termite gut metagenome]|uniref:Antitoxin SocA-like Panacea domain-containing protein n=1 Tax=termite gut metagenome TaxID=433724 RepID=A0A5J4RFH8_9ZZZZ
MEEIIKTININDIAKYIILKLLNNGNSICPLKLQKLLYYIQSWHMVYFGRNNTLFTDVPEAWVNGPIYRNVYDSYKHIGVYDQIQGMDIGCKTNKTKEMEEELKNVYNSLNISQSQHEFLESMLIHYGTLSHDKLVFMTHLENPWNEAREGLNPIEPSDRELSLDTMYSYYKERKERKESA